MNKVQQLELVDDLFPALLTGKKTHTLRWREGPIVEGYLLFSSSSNSKLKSLVWVTNIRCAPMNEFAYLYNMTPEELHKSIQRHYPDIEIDAEVLFVEHLTPQQTEKEHGIPKEWQGKTITNKTDLFSH